MTREEVIKWLKDMLKNVDLPMEQYQTALEMVIKLVEQEPCVDAISRKAVKKLFEDGDVIGIYDFLGIGDLPSVQPKTETGWIPVSEKLPEEGKDVLVYIERNAWDEDGLRFRKKCIDIGWQIGGRWHCIGCDGVVWIAWQELPKPYEPQEKEAKV